MRTFFLIFALFSVQSLFAQEEVIDLWPKQIPNSSKIQDEEIVKHENIIRIENVSKPTLAIFLPSKEMATGKAVVICPGGGYHHLAYSKEGTDLAKWFNSHGIAAFVLKYRMPIVEAVKVRHLAPLQDAQRALRIVRNNAKKWNINADQIGIMGFSAGGHLASTLGTHYEEPNAFDGDEVDKLSARPDFMILIYPVVSMQEGVTHQGSRDNLLGKKAGAVLIEKFSNELQVTEKTPPTFIVHSTDDKAVPIANSLRLLDALREKNVPAEMHIYPYGGHGFGMAMKRGRLSKWRDQLLEWIVEL